MKQLIIGSVVLASLVMGCREDKIVAPACSGDTCAVDIAVDLSDAVSPADAATVADASVDSTGTAD